MTKHHLEAVQIKSIEFFSLFFLPSQNFLPNSAQISIVDSFLQFKEWTIWQKSPFGQKIIYSMNSENMGTQHYSCFWRTGPTKLNIAHINTTALGSLRLFSFLPSTSVGLWLFPKIFKTSASGRTEVAADRQANALVASWVQYSWDIRVTIPELSFCKELG